MINVGMTIREMVSIASNPSCNGDLYDRIIKALELATGNEKLLVGCNGVVFNGNFWDAKIAAIKSLRLATGMGLKDAKDWVEEVQFNNKTIYTKPLEPEVAHKLCEELGKCGCSCWTTNA
jgi:ribosomal protein L7/L12